jgi:hypothetical protein
MMVYGSDAYAANYPTQRVFVRCRRAAGRMYCCRSGAVGLRRISRGISAMFASRNMRHFIAAAFTVMGLAGAGAAVASPAQAATVFKELEYRGNTSKLVMTAFGNVNGASVRLQPDTNSKFGQWAQTATVSSGGGQPAFIYTLRASMENGGAHLCLTAKDTVNVVVAVCDFTDSQKWFHPTAVSGPGGTLPTKNVQTLRHLGQSQSSQAPLSQFAQIGVHFWAKRTV